MFNELGHVPGFDVTNCAMVWNKWGYIIDWSAIKAIALSKYIHTDIKPQYYSRKIAKLFTADIKTK